MTYLRIRSAVGLALVAALSAAVLTAQSTVPRAAATDALQQATQHLRAAYYARDFDGGYRESEALVRRFPDSPEARAWRVVFMSAKRPILPMAELRPDARDAADALARISPSSPWYAFARGTAAATLRSGLDKALTFADTALSVQPANEDFIQLKASVLCRMGLRKEAETLLDARIKKAPSAQLLAAKAEVIAAQVYGPAMRRDSDAVARSLAVYAEVRALDPTNVGGWALDAGLSCMDTPLPSARTAEGHPFYRRAAELAPFAEDVHAKYWKSILALPDRSDDSKRAEVEADIDRTLAARPNDPFPISMAAAGYRVLLQKWPAIAAATLKEKERAAEERVLGDFPTSLAASQVWSWQLLWGRRWWPDGSASQNASEAEKKDADAAWFKDLVAFVERPEPRSRTLLADLYNSWRLIDNDRLTPEMQVRFIHAWDRADPSDPGPENAILLADHRLDLAFARQITLRYDTGCRAGATNTRETYGTLADYAQAVDNCSRDTHEALGWIAFAEGHLPEAERELRAVLALKTNRHDTYVLYHLGRVLEAAGRLDDAEAQYFNGLAEDAGFSANYKALEQLYRTRHPDSGANFDAYLRRLKDEIATRQRQEIAASRLVPAKPLRPFSLEQLGTGTHLDSGSLTGKIVVINVWGTWCGPCVAEIPKLKQFYESIKSDPSVIFLSIDLDDARTVVTDFLAKNTLPYPVLFDDGWVKPSNVTAFPTTLFIDRQGRVAFRHVGMISALEDFAIRIEMLKADPERRP